ncbi:hypothetical protein K435DRAFT_841857 [Dendrothele bispora CBS 962.96]|uniref:MARVEL domain-containing protein n=1 Tax=Dendrothele bispora (strain CBS 962.96) TaxID=1314807 RepID=A0A4V4HE06_DENBC|nr:hypothetical protein K435DRAFT_841857 [Dendrothele bispora CBS 962.96]
MSRPHFLFCLPIRLGAFFVSLLTLLLSLFISVVGWRAVYLSRTQDSDHLSTRQLIFLIIYSVVYTLLALTSFFGLIGVLTKRISWISTFKSFLQGFTFGATIAAIINIVFLFVDRDGDCVIGSDQRGNCLTQDDAHGWSRTTVVVVALCFFLIPLVIMAYGCWLLSDCVKYLYDREAMRGVSLYPFSSKYAAVPNREEHA